VETTAAVGDDLYRVTENLNDMLSQFKFERHEYVVSAESEKRRSPRLQNHLRVRVEVDGKFLEGTSKDFSMTGMQLRMNESVDFDKKVRLQIYIPYTDLQEYQNQQPVKIDGKVLWTGQDEKYHSWGIDFIDVQSDQEDWMKKCFDFFNKSPYYFD
jgi:methyl-accepting chemotaxis protein